MSDIDEKKQETREQRFKRIIRKYNEKTGFDFTLDDLNKDETYKYAHATHLGKTFRITCQLDTDSEFLYGLHVTFEGMPQTMHFDDSLDSKRLNALIKTDAFNTRIGALKLLEDLKERLAQQINQVTLNIFTDTLEEIEMQDAYDTISTAARKLLRQV